MNKAKTFAPIQHELNLFSIIAITAILGKHRIGAHNGDDYEVKCSILPVAKDISARKALEALWIFSRDPVMNNRNERLSVTSDFLQSLPYYEL